MLNLQIISDSSKADIIMARLQTMLRVKIDILGDFDLGLKEVFEKRPAVVLIQEQITGVSAENAARHIQMLLGNGAPKFILMHEGNHSLQPIKGLFEYVVDLNMPAVKFFEDLLLILKLIYGDQWDRIFIRSADVASLKSDAQEPFSCVEAEETLVDELFSELHDETEPVEKSAAPIQTEPLPPLAVKVSQDSTAVQSNPRPVAIPIAPQNKNGENRTDQTSQVISKPLQPELTDSHEDILLSFEENYRADSSHLRTIVIIALIVVSVAGGWYALQQNPRLFSFLQNKQAEPKPSAIQPVVTPPAVAVTATADNNPQKAFSSTSRKQEKAVTEALPSFIPSGSRDLSFSENKPGWERYISGNHDFRLFRANGRIKAIQVLSYKKQPLTDSFLQSVLKEFAGDGELTKISSEQKQDVVLQRYQVSTRGEVLAYRKKSTGELVAFVVSKS